MKKDIAEMKNGKSTLILKDNYRAMLTANSSVTYSHHEVMNMYRKYFPSKKAEEANL